MKTGTIMEENVKRIPYGVSNFVEVVEQNQYYVDKTMYLPLLEQQPNSLFFIRPRRFGKSIFLSMLRAYYDIAQKEKFRKRFEGLWIGGQPTPLQGKFQILYLDFSRVGGIGALDRNFDDYCSGALNNFALIYEPYYYPGFEKDMKEQSGSTNKLNFLDWQAHNTGAALYLIIDEYDTPIQEGYSKDFYDEIISFMRNFFSGAFKDNKNLSYGFLTGILRIAQESIFSGLNNLTVNSVMDEEYDSFFGFTSNEVKEMLEYYAMTEKESELKEWYDGYLFGNEEIYNPWSVINYISRGGIPQAYWVNTGNNEILEDVMRVATDDITDRLYALLQGNRVVARIDQNVVYRSLAEDPANIYSLLLVAGYLKTPKKELQADGSYLCEVSIPNREIAAVYKSEILSHFLQIGAITRTTANKIAESLYANDYKKLQSAVAEYMDKSISFYDGGAEGFYHGLMLGLIALMDNQYKIKSNRESGDGRYDVCLIPREKRYPGIILELKWEKGLGEAALDSLADEALVQIDALRYDSEMKEDGIIDILKFGIAFSGKKVSVKTK